MISQVSFIKKRTIMCQILNGYGIMTFWLLEEKARFTENIRNNIIKNILSDKFNV